MDLKHLHYFLVASEYLSFAAAAENLYTTRQAVSYAVKCLEKELNIRLFDRCNNALRLTKEGTEFARRTRMLIRQTNELKRDFTNLVPNEKTRVRLAIDPANIAFRGNVLSSIFDYVNKMDNIELLVSEASGKACYDRIIQRKVDMALFKCMDRDFPECETLLLKKSNFRLMVGPDNPLAGKGRIAITDLEDVPFVLPRGYSFTYHVLFNKCRKSGFQCRVKNMIDDVELAFIALLHDNCVLVTGEEDDDGKFVTIPFEDPDMYWCDYLVYHKDIEELRAVQNVVEYIEGYFHSIGGKA